MARRGRKGAAREMGRQVRGVLLLALALFCFYCLVRPAQMGGLGALAYSGQRALAGEAAAVIPLLIALAGLVMILPRRRAQARTRLNALLLLPPAYPVWIHLQLIERGPGRFGTTLLDNLQAGLAGEGGGFFGALVATGLHYLLGFTGSRIFLGALLLVVFLVAFNLSLGSLISPLPALAGILGRVLRAALRSVGDLLRQLAGKAESLRQAKVQNGIAASPDALSETSPGQHHTDQAVPAGPPEKDLTMVSTADGGLEKAPGEDTPKATKGEESLSPVRGGKSFASYLFPPLQLLATNKTSGEHQQQKSSKERAKILEKTLLDFGVRARVSHVQAGPTVTRFEVQPEAGVKVSKFIGLSDDLALNLAAPLVRIEAPIPGKAALGIEVPNAVISLVHVREVLEGELFTRTPSPLTIGVGKDITGVPVVADLTRMPHLLIAGATGAGKSVCLNTLITSILYKAGPDRVRFMMIDPKVVELSVYNGIPHLLLPVITDPRKASLALRNMVREMGRRYDLFAGLEVRDISTYNELAINENLEQLPYIVVLIDELADLMHVSPGEVEDSIARLAQMSRAAGIHLVVATQRPSVDVLTGIIKANITSRIAFAVTSQVDSRTILDTAGAEKLLGRGDMLFYPVGAVKPFRVQGAYVSEAEVKKITDYIKEQGLLAPEEASAFLTGPDEVEEEETDALFAEAVDLVVRTGSASISLLQRRFRIGYTRAARLIDDLERRGVVGPFEGSKPREVLITAEQAARICEEGRDRED